MNKWFRKILGLTLAAAMTASLLPAATYAIPADSGDGTANDNL